jgi:hypothetical protein
MEIICRGLLVHALYICQFLYHFLLPVNGAHRHCFSLLLHRKVCAWALGVSLSLMTVLKELSQHTQSEVPFNSRQYIALSQRYLSRYKADSGLLQGHTGPLWFIELQPAPAKPFPSMAQIQHTLTFGEKDCLGTSAGGADLSPSPSAHIGLLLLLLLRL